MLSNNELKYYSGLLQKKFRDLESKFIVEGKRLFDEALKSKLNCELACVTNQFNDTYPEIIQTIKQKNIRLEIVSSQIIQKLCDTKSPQGIVGIYNKTENQNISFHNSSAELIVALDQVSDPGNLGTIIRTCDWFGIENIVLSESCVELYNPKVVRSSMGSLFHVKAVLNVNLIEHLNSYKTTHKVLIADLSGTNFRDYHKQGKTVIIFSNEAHGPSKELLKLVDEKINIEGSGKAESLNVASAAAIIISHLTSS